LIRKGSTLRAALLAAVSSAHAAATDGPMRLSTLDTTLTFEAGAASPRATQLAFGNGKQSWSNRASEPLVAQAEVNGKVRAIRWQYFAAASQVTPTHVQLVYESPAPHLQLIWEWQVRASPGPIEHRIEIRNLSDDDVWLPQQESLGFQLDARPTLALQQTWIEKGASSPSSVGVHHASLEPGFKWTGTSSTYAHPPRGEQREMIPYVLIESLRGDHFGLYAGIEFSGRTRFALSRDRGLVNLAAGLNPLPGPFRTRLRPGESFHAPTVFIGAFRGGPDVAGNTLRRWVRMVLNNPTTIRNPSYPLLVSNSWGSGMAINETQAHKMIEDAGALGLEMFHLDAGWFRGVGDWTSNPSKFPHSVSAVADYAHHFGLKFGLWTDWTQAGVSNGGGSLNVNDPATRDWLTVDPPPGWKPAEFKGIAIDIGLPAAREWALRKVETIVRDYRIDMLEHDGYLVSQGCDRVDHPHAPPDPAHTRHFRDEDFEWSEGPNSTDVSYHATRAYYDIYAEVRRNHPRLLFEICNDGGRMVDFGSAAHGDYFSMSDGYDPLSNRRAFYDASYVFPPAMLEAYVEKWPAPRLENFIYMLRSGMMGWFSLMQDSSLWSPEQRAAARAEFELYKSNLRPLIRQADLYHVTPRPDGVSWDGIEYFDPASRRGVLFAFRGTTPEASSHVFALKGLEYMRQYHLAFQDHTSADRTVHGLELMRDGVKVTLPRVNASELVFFDQL
jgi:alpha-galactosidase